MNVGFASLQNCTLSSFRAAFWPKNGHLLKKNKHGFVRKDGPREKIYR